MIMNLIEFLHNDQPHKAIQDASVVCLQADSSDHAKTGAYPFLFCRQFVAHCARMHDKEIVPGSMGGEQSTSTMASLQSTFLGNVSWYWLGADEQLSKKEFDVWHAYLAAYSGPNKLFFFTIKPLKSTKSRLVVTLPVLADRDLFLKLSMMVADKKARAVPCVASSDVCGETLAKTQAWAEASAGRRDFANQIYRVHTKIPLDTAVLLAHYGGVVGKNGKLFVAQWLPELVEAEGSLFSLSQTLFAKQSRSFFRQWKEMRAMYGMPFWISFWAEQFWQAYAYVRLHKAGKEAEAKRVGYRLPFSFKNRDWRLYSLFDLQQNYHQLYDIDFHLKNGGSEGVLELFFMRVLEREG